MEPRRRNHLIWIGTLLTFLGVASYFFYFVRFPVLRDFPWLNLPLVLAGVAAAATGVWRAFRRPRVYRGRVLGTAGLVLSLLLGGLFVFYVFSLSYWLPDPSRDTLDLSAAPGFRLESMTGEPVAMEDYRGRPVILVFYRGHW